MAQSSLENQHVETRRVFDGRTELETLLEFMGQEGGRKGEKKFDQKPNVIKNATERSFFVFLNTSELQEKTESRPN